MRRLWIALILLLLGAVPALADKPVPPHNWERVVGSYRFVMLAREDQTPTRYPSSGLYRADGPPEPLWTVEWYANEGEVFIGPDGEYLARLGPWPGIGEFDELAVAFYRNGTRTKWYSVRELVERPEALPQSVSHYMWHGDVTYDPGQLRLTVPTIPGATYLFDVTSGEIVRPRAADAEEAETKTQALTPTLIVTVGGLLLAGGLWFLLRRRRGS